MKIGEQFPSPTHASAAWLPGEQRSQVPATPPDAVISRDEQAERWTARISRTFVPLSATPCGPGAFHGDLHVIERGPVTLARIAGSAQKVSRGRAELAKSSRSEVYLNVQLTGLGRVNTVLGQAATTVGQLALVSSQDAFELEFPGAFTQLCVAMPADWLAERLRNPLWRSTGRTIDLAKPVGRIVHAAIGALIDAASEGEDDLADCSDLLALALDRGLQGGDAPQPRAPGEAQWSRRIDDWIQRRLKDPELTPSIAAQELGCSVSTLHLHCRATGSSFGRLLMDARLDLAAALLRAAPMGHGRVAAISYACGLTDPSHFARAFKARYGILPSVYR